MLILAFETSAKAASAALLEDGKLLAESYQNTGLTHSQTLMVMAENLLHQCGKTVNDVNAVAVAAGPGSFTGVRIGVAAAKGFAWGREVPCYGISTLEAMALSLGEYQGYVCPVMDARRSQVYNALFYVNHGSLKRITEDRAIALAQLKQELAHLTEPVFLVAAFSRHTAAVHRFPDCLRRAGAQQRAQRRHPTDQNSLHTRSPPIERNGSMLVFLLLMNASGFAIMLLDKNLARCHRRRVPEALLLAFAACFGSLGVLAGMYVCRHKTRKPLFTITVPLLLLAQCAILYFLFR